MTIPSDSDAVEVTLADALYAATQALTRAGVPEPRRDAGLLLEYAAGVSRETLLTESQRRLEDEAGALFRELTARRAAREPVSRILGHREFWSLDFRLAPATLDPRPDSETVVAAVLEHLGDREAPLTILDLGTGTGCLLLALLSELPRAWGVGVDLNIDAVRTACENAYALDLGRRVGFVAGDWADSLTGRFNVVLTNPPYVRSGDIPGLEPEIAVYDPRRALDGGADGLDAYRTLAPQLEALTSAAGMVALEIGADQAATVAAILETAGLAVVDTRQDLSGMNRCLLGRHR